MAYADFSDVPGYGTSMLWRSDRKVYASTASTPATALETGALAAWDDDVLAKRLTPSTSGGSTVDIFRAAGRTSNGLLCPVVSSPWAALVEGFGPPINGCVLSGTISAVDARNCTIYMVQRRPVRSPGTGVAHLYFTGGTGSDWGPFGTNYTVGNTYAVNGLINTFAPTVQLDMGMSCLVYVGNSSTSYTIQQGSESATITDTVPSTAKTTVTWQGISNSNTMPGDKVLLWIFPGTRHSAQERADVMALIESHFGIDVAERTHEFCFMGDSIIAGQAASLGGTLVNQVVQPARTCLFVEAWPGAQIHESGSIQGLIENWTNRASNRIRSGIKVFVPICIGRNDMAVGSMVYGGGPADTIDVIDGISELTALIVADGGYPILMPILDSQIAGDVSGTATLRTNIGLVNDELANNWGAMGAVAFWDPRDDLPELYASGSSTTRSAEFNSDGVHPTWVGNAKLARWVSSKMALMRNQPDPYAEVTTVGGGWSRSGR